MAKNDFARGEFMEFLDTFLRAHPEVIDDQKAGWNMFWQAKRERTDELGECVEDVLAEDMSP